MNILTDNNLVTFLPSTLKARTPSGQTLGIAHAKLNADFDKAYRKLKLKPDDEHINHVKSFTKPDGDQMSG